MKSELTGSILFANRIVVKYRRYFYIEVSVGSALDLIAVYAAISRLVVVLDYISFILPAIPLIFAMVQGTYLGRGVWWWVNEGTIYYISSLPFSTPVFLFSRTAFSLAYEYYVSSIPYYVAMIIVGLPLERMFFVFIGSTALFLLMSSVGELLASSIRDWFKVSALTSLVEWPVLALTPTLYSLEHLKNFSITVYHVVASNPLTWLVETARTIASFSEVIYFIPMLAAAFLIRFSMSYQIVKKWRE